MLRHSPPFRFTGFMRWLKRQIESAVAAEVVDQVEPELKAVAPVRLRRRLDLENALAVLLHEVVVDGAEHVEAVEPEELVRELRGVERLPERHLDPVRDDRVVERARVRDPHFVDDEVGRDGAAGGAPGRRPTRHRTRRAPAGGSPAPAAASSPASIASGAREKSENESSPSTGTMMTSRGVVALMSSARLRVVRRPVIWSSRVRRLPSCSFSRRGLVMSTPMMTSAPSSRAMRTGKFAAMPPSVSGFPSISTGGMTPGTDMLARIAVASDPWSRTTTSPSDEVGRHRAIGDRKAVEVALAGRFDLHPLKQQLHVLPAEQRGRHVRLPPLEAHLDRDEEAGVVGLAAVRAELARQLVVEDPTPVDRGDLLLDLVDRPAGGVEPADDRAHARAHDHVHGDVVLLELLDDADVGRTAGAAAGEDEDDLRAAWGWVGLGLLRGRGNAEQALRS